MLAEVSLTDEDKTRLRAVVLDRLQFGQRRSRNMLNALARVAAVVRTPEFDEALTALPRSPNPVWWDDEQRFLDSVLRTLADRRASSDRRPMPQETS